MVKYLVETATAMAFAYWWMFAVFAIFVAFKGGPGVYAYIGVSWLCFAAGYVGLWLRLRMGGD